MEPQKKNFEGFGADQTQPPGKLTETFQQTMASQERKEKETEECLKLASKDKETVSTVDLGTEKGFGAGLASPSAKEISETPGKEIFQGKSCREEGREDMLESALKEQGVAAMAETETAWKGSTNLLQRQLKGDSGLQKDIQGKEDIQGSPGIAFMLQKEAGSHLSNKQTQPAKLKVNSGLQKPAVTMETGPEEGGGNTLDLAAAENFLQDFFFFDQYKETYCLNTEKLGGFLGLLEESIKEFELDSVFTEPEEATEFLQKDFYLREMQNRAYLGVDSIREILQELNDYGRSLLRKPVGERKQEEYESLLNTVTSISECNEEVRKDLQVYKERKGLLLQQFLLKKTEEKGKEKPKIRRDRQPKLHRKKFLAEEALNTSRDRSPLKPGSGSEEELCPVSPYKGKHAQPGKPEATGKEACAGQLAGTVPFNPIKLTNESGSEGVERLEGPSFQERRESGMECSGISSLLASSESLVESSSEEEQMEEEGAGGESQKNESQTMEGGKGLSRGKKVTKDYLIRQYDTDFQSVEEGEGTEREGTLSEGSKNTILSRERQISAAWTQCLYTPWNKATNIILPKDFDKYDTLKLWGYTVAHVALPGSKERLPGFKKYSRDKLWGILEKSFPLLKSVLSGLTVEQSPEQVCYARTLTLEIVEHLLLGRKPKTSVIILPDWLREDQLMKTFQEIHRTWECAPENLTPLVWTQMDNTSKMVTREAWMEWLLMVTADLRQRRKIAKQSGFDPTEEKAKGTGQEKIREKWRNWKGPDPAAELERSPAGRVALSSSLGARATVPPPATGEDLREGRGRREVQRMGNNVQRERAGNVGLRGTLSDISDSDLDRGVSDRASKKPRRERAWGDRVEMEVGLAAGEGGNGFGVGKQREGLGRDGGPGGTSMEDAAGLGVSFPQGERNDPLLMAEMRTREPGTRPKRLLEDADASGNGRFLTRPKTNVTSKGKSVSLNSPPDTRRKGREGDDTRGNDTQGEAPRGASALPPGLPGGRTGGKPQEPRKDRGTYASIAGRGTGAAGRSNISGLTEEEEEYLDSFFHEASDVRNPRTRYVVRFRYLGSDPERGSRAYMSKRLLRDTLDASREEIVAVIQLPGSREIDVCLASEKVYREFWMKCKTVKRLSPELLTEYEMVPLFRGDTKVLTVSFRTTTIPAQDVARWVSKYATILSGPDKKEDEQGYWTGEYRCVVSFKNEDPEYRHGKIPKYFFLGADRGITRYSGQPQACFHCGSYDHQRRLCTTPLCSRCGARGHPTVACHSSIRCNFCGELGHTYFWCPQAYYNQQDAKVFEKAQQVARTGKERAQSKEQTRVLRDALRARGEELPPGERRENRERNQDPGPLLENRQHEAVNEGKDAEWNVVPGRGVGRKDGNPQRKEKVREEAVRGHNRFYVLAEEERRADEETGSVPKEFSDRELLVAVEGEGDRQPKQAGGAKGQRSPRSSRSPRSKRHGAMRNQVGDQETEQSKTKGKVVGSGESAVEGPVVLLSGGSPEGMPEAMVTEIVIQETIGVESVASPMLFSEEVEVSMQELDSRLMKPPDAESGLCFPPPFPPPPYPAPPDVQSSPLPSRPPDPDGPLSISSCLLSLTVPNLSHISETTPSGLPEEVERSRLEPVNQRDRAARETERLEIDLD